MLRFQTNFQDIFTKNKQKIKYLTFSVSESPSLLLLSFPLDSSRFSRAARTFGFTKDLRKEACVINQVASLPCELQRRKCIQSVGYACIRIKPLPKPEKTLEIPSVPIKSETFYKIKKIDYVTGLCIFLSCICIKDQILLTHDCYFILLCERQCNCHAKTCFKQYNSKKYRVSARNILA